VKSLTDSEIPMASHLTKPQQDRDHWLAKVVFALMMTALVGAQLAMQFGMQLLPDNWP